jgi:hypothetical protein
MVDLDPNTIKKKKLLIVATMEEMPKTEHDLLNSCFLDVTLQVKILKYSGHF